MSLPTHVEDELTGRTLSGRYRLERLLAAGGMARVYAGSDLILNRPVAVKVLHANLAADRQFVERFRREAVAAARLNHPGIVAVYDSCSDGNIEAIILELVPGENLRRCLDERTSLSVRETLAIGVQVTDALAAAHRAGIVHRDIKPANILITPGERSDQPRVRVTDFGVAKAQGTSDLTNAGSVVGTAKYLAPEQVEGGAIDARADIYALGAVLYEAVCGRPPFQADSDLATALARLHNDPLLPRQLRADLPRAFERVILKALARHPDDRYPDAAALRAALLSAEDATIEESLGADPTNVVVVDPSTVPSFIRSERSWLAPGLAVLAVAALLTALAVLVGRTDAGRGFVDRALSVVGVDRERANPAPTTVPPPSGPVAIAQASPFDPEDGGRNLRDENQADIANLIDGLTTTSWSTDPYYDNFPKLKSGVGVVLRLGEPSTLRNLVVRSPDKGWSADIFVSASTEPTTLAGWGPRVATAANIAGDGHFDLGGAQGQLVLIWITNLVRADNRNGVRWAVELREAELSS